MRRFLVLGVIASAVVVMGCGASRQSGICGDVNPSASATGDAASLEQEAEAAWAKRGDLAEAEKAVAKWDQLLKVDPSRADVRVKLARAHYFIADSHLFFKMEVQRDEQAGAQMLDHYQQGQFQAEMALGQKYAGYRTKFCARQPFDAALQQLDKDAVPAMYWYATNLGRYALQKSLVEVLNHKDRIKAMMDTIQRLDPAYWYYASDRYFGAYYTKIPFPSGDLPKSAGYFGKSIDGAPAYLASKVIFARMNLAKAGDRAKFKQMLDEVVAFDLSQAPEIEPENAAEQQKAKYYLDQIDVLVEED
ncbi:MAG: hypothetical protein EP329_20550 [Deltaproteobacteria bacterium]|nr:MAG: hypothetical protein EP329_20550 [Deltaproteobacteria bacterium]